MSKTCNNCGTDKKPSSVPYSIWEDMLESNKRKDMRHWIFHIIAIIAILLSIGIATYERLQYDYVSEEIVTVDGKDGIANYIGNDGDIINGENSSTESENP